MSATEEYISCYLTGEMSRIVNVFKFKLEMNTKVRPDNVYNLVYTLRCGGRDPVGNLATRIADFSIERENTYNFYSELKDFIDEVVKRRFSDVDMDLLSAYLGFTSESLTSVSKKHNVYWARARMRAEEVNNLLQKEIELFLIEKRVLTDG